MFDKQVDKTNSSLLAAPFEHGRPPAQPRPKTSASNNIALLHLALLHGLGQADGDRCCTRVAVLVQVAQYLKFLGFRV